MATATWFREYGKEEDNGHPCLVLLFFVFLIYCIFYNIQNKLTNDCMKPCFYNVVKQNFQFDLLKAFSSSKEAMMVASCCTDKEWIKFPCIFRCLSTFDEACLI